MEYHERMVIFKLHQWMQKCSCMEMHSLILLWEHILQISLFSFEYWFMEVIRFNAPLGLQQVAMYGAYVTHDWVLNLWESYQQTLLGNPANIKL